MFSNPRKTKPLSRDNKRIFFQHLYFDRARSYGKNTANWFSTKIKTEANIDQVSKLIDQKFANASSPTRTISEQVFKKEQAQQFVDMAMVIQWVLGAVFFTLILIVCNCMIQVIRDRLNEIAMMKALGFSSFSLTNQIFLESLLLLGMGAFIGSLLASLTLNQVQIKMSSFLPGIAIDNSHFLLVTLLVIVAAIISSLFPAISIYRLLISHTLGAKS